MIEDEKKHPEIQETEGTEDWLANGMSVFFLIAGIVGVLVMGATVYFADVTHIWHRSVTNSDAGFGSGVFGDAFGFTTSIFTGAAFLGLMVTMRLQRIELKEIRQERQLAQKTFKHQLDQSKIVEKELQNRTLEERALHLIEVIRQKTAELPSSHSGPGQQIGKDLAATIFGAFHDISQFNGNHLQINQRLNERIFLTNDYIYAKQKYSFPEARTALKAMQKAELVDDFLPLLKNAITEDCYPVYMAQAIQLEWENQGVAEEIIPLIEDHEKFDRFMHALNTVRGPFS